MGQGRWLKYVDVGKAFLGILPGDPDAQLPAAFAALSSRGLPTPIMARVAVVIDWLAAPGTEYTLNLPLVAGATFIPSAAQVFFDTAVGLAVGNLNISVGNANGPAAAPKANLIGTTNIGAATLNNAIASLPYRFVLSTGATGPAINMTTTVPVLRINSLPTGLSALTGRFYMFGSYE